MERNSESAKIVNPKSFFISSVYTAKQWGENLARIYTNIEAKEFISGQKIKLEILTSNDGTVLSIQPCAEDRFKVLSCEDTVTLPKRIWDKIPHASKYWNVERNMEPKKEQDTVQ